MKEEISRYLDKNSIQTKMFKYVVDIMKKGGSMYDYTGIKPMRPNINIQSSSCGKSETTKPTMSQFIFYKMCKAINDGYTSKGLLGWFSTGAGKTVVTASIFDAFSSTKTCYYISRHDSLKPHSEIHKYLKMIWGNDINIINFKKKFKIMSIASFSNKVKNNLIQLTNCCIIIDEAQYLFANRAVPMLKSKHEYLVNRLSNNRNMTCKVFILTATPGDSLKEMITLLNIINEENVTESNFKEKIRDNVFFLDMYKDKSLFPSIDIRPIKSVNLNEGQKEKYKEKAKKTNYNKNINTKDIKLLQKWSNELYSNKNIFSNKIKEVYNYIKKHDNQKHYVYSQYYKQGIQDVMKYLETKGYQRVTKTNMNKKGKKYILAKASEKFKASDKENVLLGKFNSSENKNGDYIEIFLATDSYNTGLDLKAVRHVHLLEPLTSFVEKKQGVGRAARLCSHSQIPFSDWNVKVHQYVSKLDGKNIIDDYVLTKTKKEFEDYDKNVMIVKNSAVDCKVMTHFHNQGLSRSDPDYRTCIEGNSVKDIYATDPSKKVLSIKNRKEIENKLAKKREYIYRMEKAAKRAKNLKDNYIRMQKGVNIIKKQIKEKENAYKRAINRKNKLIYAKGVTGLKGVMKKIRDDKKKAAKFAKRLAIMKRMMNIEKAKMEKERLIREEKMKKLKKLKENRMRREQLRQNAIRKRKLNEQMMKKKLKDIKVRAKAKVNTGMFI